MATKTELAGQQDFFTVIKERHSVRKYDPAYEMTEEEIQLILNDAIKAPSSSNLQPWRFIVVQAPELKQKLLPIANNQAQVVEASAVIVVLGDIEAYRNADKIYSLAAEKGYMSEEIKERMVANTLRYYPQAPDQKRKEIALIDGGLVSMQLMLAAKARGYDTVPMGGYDPVKLRELFDIPPRYTDVMLIALGKAAIDAHGTVRLPLQDITYWNEFKG
ncbi:nitroreductase family protein [Paenibacillus senegalensis]|uniref:nitroreductase family protein n=1 Tax=Paenibacillus senegalensis TaxID=1465766 RepID=UPI0002881A0D|nr:nitroreductase family protein [Paenibacillus senegalensis]